MSTSITTSEKALFERVAEIIEASRAQVSRSINTTTVHAYWFIGREIVEVQQEGKERAEYGEGLIKRLAQRLTERYGKGFSYPSVKRMKQFYLTYPKGSAIPQEIDAGQKGSAAPSLFEPAPPSEKGSTAMSQLPPSTLVPFPSLLSWTHYLTLLKVKDPRARAFYEIEAAKESWSTRELERQVASMLFERLTMSQDKDKVLALAKEGQQVLRPLPARRGRGADGRHRALLREERRHGPHHPGRGQRADPRQPIPALPPHRGAAPRGARHRARASRACARSRRVRRRRDSE